MDVAGCGRMGRMESIRSDSVGQGGEEVEVDGRLERGGGAQHDQIAVLGPHQLQADRQATAAHGDGHAGGGERVMLKG